MLILKILIALGVAAVSISTIGVFFSVIVLGFVLFIFAMLKLEHTYQAGRHRTGDYGR